ncbi:hypothetical protein V5799_017961 [Amblyomma americanum]|uniref:C2 domain-containing protein n=1 Tax=Amblyomma americanum TaxID=6943 RepID=A0AAQ4F1V5_AMBAM
MGLFFLVAAGVYVWAIAAGIVTGAVLLALIVWLVLFRLRGAKRKRDSAEPPLLTREPWHRKSMLSQPLAGVLTTKAGGLDRGSPPSLLTPESFDVQPAQLTVAEPVQPLARPGFVRWNSFCSPSAEGLVGNLLPKGCNVGYSWSDDEDSTVPRCTNGRLWFSLNYKPESEELDVHIVKAKYLPGRGLTNTPRDPFVRAYLLPDENTFQQSSVKTRTLAPKFDETLTFKTGRKCATAWATSRCSWRRSRSLRTRSSGWTWTTCPRTYRVPFSVLTLHSGTLRDGPSMSVQVPRRRPVGVKTRQEAERRVYLSSG